jgi:hypothetical protein
MNAQDDAALIQEVSRLSQMLGAIAARLAALTPAPPPPPAPVAAAQPVPARQPRLCGQCRRPGHTRNRCPDLAPEYRTGQTDAERAAGRAAAEAERVRQDADRVLAEAAAAPPRLHPALRRYTPSVQTDCPVCLENKMCCVLACDHHLCRECVLGQQVNGLLNCGLCRAPLYAK